MQKATVFTNDNGSFFVSKSLVLKFRYNLFANFSNQQPT